MNMIKADHTNCFAWSAQISESSLECELDQESCSESDHSAGQSHQPVEPVPCATPCFILVFQGRSNAYTDIGSAIDIVSSETNENTVTKMLITRALFEPRPAFLNQLGCGLRMRLYNYHMSGIERIDAVRDDFQAERLVERRYASMRIPIRYGMNNDI